MNKKIFNFKKGLIDKKVKKVYYNSIIKLDSKLKNILIELELNDISYLEIKKFIDNEILDYQEFLKYYVLSGKLNSHDEALIEKLDDVSRLTKNPIDSLKKMQCLLNQIRVDLMNNYDENISDAIKREEILKYLKEKGYANAVFLAYFVARNRDFRVENREILKNISLNIAVIERIVKELNKQEEINYDGINYILYGNNKEKLEKSLIMVIETVFKLPDVIKKQLKTLKSIQIYDTEDPINLFILLSNNTYLHDENKKSFFANGDSNENEIRLFSQMFNRDSQYFFHFLAHEAGHILDKNIMKEYYNCNGNFTEVSSLWKEAIICDKKMISKYGNTQVAEDFAEFTALFAEALVGYRNIDALKKEYKERYRVMCNYINLINIKYADTERKNK